MPDDGIDAQADDREDSRENHWIPGEFAYGSRGDEAPVANLLHDLQTLLKSLLMVLDGSLASRRSLPIVLVQSPGERKKP